jgi:regulatory protein
MVQGCLKVWPAYFEKVLFCLKILAADKNTAPKKLTPQQALPKLKQFCAYQERCHSEVKEKLYSYAVYRDDAEEIISKLIEENYLNEERFACSFAGGRFRIRQWGKMKIKYELKQKGVSEYCIKKALQSIDLEEYEQCLHKLADQKLKTLRSEKNMFIKKRKLQDFLLQRGFETGLVREVVNKT